MGPAGWQQAVHFRGTQQCAMLNMERDIGDVRPKSRMNNNRFMFRWPGCDGGETTPRAGLMPLPRGAPGSPPCASGFGGGGGEDELGQWRSLIEIGRDMLRLLMT
ncbi:hypothetical protein NHX12_005113, partial [Muraenolepis orangiensis]